MNNHYENSDWSTALIDMINRPGVKRENEEPDKIEEAELRNSDTDDGQEGKKDESEPSLLERTKEVMENIGITINSI